MALMEEFFPGKGENLHDYLIPTIGDVPVVESILIEDPSPIGPFGAKGIGEQAVIPTAPAILNAIHHATGYESVAHRNTGPSSRGDRCEGLRGRGRRSWLMTRSVARPVRCFAISSQAERARAIATESRRTTGTTRPACCAGSGDVARRFAGSVSCRPDREWDGSIVKQPETFITAIGAGTTYPDYKPAPFSISSEVEGVDMVTVVTEGIFSYCGVKVKIDTDRHLGPECNLVRAKG